MQPAAKLGRPAMKLASEDGSEWPKEHLKGGYPGGRVDGTNSQVVPSTMPSER